MGRIRTIQRAIAGATLVATAVAIAGAPVRAQQLPSDEPLFVTASVDNDQPYIGQQITYTSKIYRRSGFPHRVHYEPPTFAGFWNPRATEKEPPPEWERETVNSTEYDVRERRTILFPSVVETLNIEPGVLTANTSEGSIVVESVAVPVDVRPLTMGGPAGFTGAVGRFEVSADVDTTTIRMNESVQLTVRVEGSGNINALPAPSWPEFQGWRVIESPAVASSEIIDGRLVGSRTYERVLVPEMAGELAVPGISYTYFDPGLEQYAQTAASQIVISIAAVDGVTSVPPSVVGAEDDRAVQGAKRIKAVPPSVRKSGGKLMDSVVYWAMWCLPLLAIAGAAVWRRRRDAWEAALADSRRRNALPNARSALARAVADADDHSIAAADALLSYMSDRFGVSLTGLTREALVEWLRGAGITAELAQQVEETLDSGEAARYTPESPSAGHKEDGIGRVTQLLTELDGAIAT